MKLERSQFGFTLVELLVVIAIVAILGAIGYPIYTDQVRKARRTDARNAVQLVAMAQERFYTLNGQYTADISVLNLSDELTSGTSEEGYYSISLALLVSGNTDTYLITAAADANEGQDHDTDCASFTINHAGVQGATGDHTDNCW